MRSSFFGCNSHLSQGVPPAASRGNSGGPLLVPFLRDAFRVTIRASFLKDPSKGFYKGFRFKGSF